VDGGRTDERTTSILVECHLTFQPFLGRKRGYGPKTFSAKRGYDIKMAENVF
jgi:hypothetical protein